jgi:hypothetical protein
MNTLYFIAKCCLSAGLSCIVSIAFSVIMLVILATLVDALGLNYKGDTYWVFNIVSVSLVISWIISFASFMSIIK